MIGVCAVNRHLRKQLAKKQCECASTLAIQTQKEQKMTRILVTGGTGELGRKVVDKLLGMGHTVRVMSRRSRDANRWPGVEWAQADLATGNGLSEAVADVDTIIHAATDAGGITYDNATMSDFIRKALLRHDGSADVQGTKLLLEQARAAGVGHVVYVSIVGIEHISFAYYRHKLEAEALVRESGIPWSIARATQFYPMIDAMIRMLAKWPVVALADFRLQPNDPVEFADQLCARAAQGPGERLPDFGGPQTLTLGDLARTWLAMRGMNKPIVRIPLPGKTARELRQGALTCQDGLRGTLTWEEWLQRAYDRRAQVTAAVQM
jgi:uncharacterized protein YbjT (DUF2867 family)